MSFRPVVTLHFFSFAALSVAMAFGMPSARAESTKNSSLGSESTTGQIHFKVDAKNPHYITKALPGAKIIVEDTPQHPRAVLRSNASGEALCGELTPGKWLVVATATGFASAVKIVDVEAGKTTLVTFLLTQPNTKIYVVRVPQSIVQTAGKSGQTRGQQFIKQNTTTGGNGQNLTSVLRTNPGFATDSGGQVHPVGEHASTSYIVDGFQIPDSLMGRQGAPIIPSVLKSIDAMTGAYAPKYGRQTAAIIDVNLLTGGPKSVVHFSQSAGGFSTFETSILASGQFGKPYGLPIDKTIRQKSISYLLTADQRSTANAIQPPQPNDQTAHNAQTATYLFGHFDYHINNRSRLGFTFSTNPVETQVANRTGLSSAFAAFGEGYGFAGAQNASSGLLSQQQEGQDIYQNDFNEFGIFSLTKKLKSKSQVKIAFGMTHNAINILNNNPTINLANLPADNSIEYNPTLIRNQRDEQGSASFSMPSGHHRFEVGLTEDHQTGIDSYQLIPASQAALNYLLSGDPTVSTPDPTNPLYNLAPVGNNPSTVGVTRVGDYRAAYAQDTWQMSGRLSFNYGLRWEQYIQNETILTNGASPSPEKVTLSQLEPRFNFVYTVSPHYSFNASYNRLMIIPPSPAGLSTNPNSSVSPVAQPETVNQVQVGTTIQAGKNQAIILNYIYKQLTNQLDSGLLVPGTQVGAYASASIPGDTVRAAEFGYTYSPSNGIGPSGYISYQNAIAKIKQIPGNAYFGTPYNDHDQLNTIAIGADYTFKNKATLGIVYTYGSGFYSSVYPNQSNRHPHNQLDFNYRMPIRVSGDLWHLGFGVLNIFNDTGELNFLSGFDGTRFQQGRRISIALSGKF